MFPDISKKWQLLGFSVRFCARRQDHRVGIQGQDCKDLGRGIGHVQEDAGRPQVPLFVLCHCGRQIVGKTVQVTVLPTPTPRSAGERRRRPLQMCSLTFQKNGSGWVFACDFAPHGKTIVSASADKTLKIWDVESGKCQRTLKGHRYLCLFCAIAVGKS